MSFPRAARARRPWRTWSWPSSRWDPRFLLVSAIAVLGIVGFGQDLANMGGKPDFEQILPKVVAGYVPVGCKGLLVAAMVAAFMSTFVSTANSGVAYIVNDIYRRYINPAASQRKLVWLGYLWTVIVILAGIGIGFMTDSIHGVTRWLTSALVPAFVAPNVLKWHWWRFNGWGFFAGMVAGTAAAIVPALIDMNEIVAFLLVFSDQRRWRRSWPAWSPRRKSMDLLKQFYTTIRPWGYWGPVYRQCRLGRRRLPQERRFLLECVQHPHRHRLANCHGRHADVPGHSAERADVHLPGRFRRHVGDPQVHLVRSARPGRDVPDHGRRQSARSQAIKPHPFSHGILDAAGYIRGLSDPDHSQIVGWRQANSILSGSSVACLALRPRQPVNSTIAVCDDPPTTCATSTQP